MSDHNSDDKRYSLVIQLLVEKGIQTVDFKLSGETYKTVKNQLKQGRGFLVFHTMDQSQPVYMNLNNSNIFTAHTLEEEAPKHILTLDKEAIPAKLH